MADRQITTETEVNKEKNTFFLPDPVTKPTKSLNLNVRGLPLSATLRINEKSNALKQQGVQIYKLGLGQSPFPVPESVVQSLRNNAHQKDYLPVRGLPELRKSVANYHRSEDLVNINPENVLIGPGSKELLFLLQLTFYGEILVPSPCWVSYIPQAKIIGRNVKILKTSYKDRYRITPTKLESLLEREHDAYKPRLLILNYPDNPTGASYNEQELKKLADVASKYGVLILSDEIYGRIHHEGKHKSIARYYPEGTIISSGLSKWAGAGGWRLGTFSFPDELSWIMDSIASVASETYTSVSAPISYAACTAFNGNDEISEYLVHSRKILKALADYSVIKLRNAGVNIHTPDGAFYLFPDFEIIRESLEQKNIFSSTQMVEKLLEETGVACLPGEDFGRFEEELTVRMAYVDFDGSTVLKASMNESRSITDSFLEEFCPNVTTAITKVSNWVKNQA
jgi:aspartate aminotransferase